MPIQVIEPRRLYLQIADQIRSLIAAEEFPAGSRLPAERELAKRFGVSRPSLREALIALEVQGYVDVRPGSGVVVLTSKAATPGIRVKRDRLKSCGLEVSLRGQSQRKLPETSSQRTLPHSKRFSWQMEHQATDEPARMAADRQFHRYIASKLANKPILRLVTGLFDQGYSPLGSAVRDPF